MNAELTEEEAEAFFASLPKAENQEFEFKCSATPISDLSTKIERAASAFWNSGGGTMVIGVSGSGEPEGGIPLLEGRQSRRDWIDQIIRKVQAPAKYEVRVSQRTSNTGIFAIRFGLSNYGPHMASDYRYYIRAGAHTVPANHFIVESIRSRRAISHPIIRPILRRPPESPSKVQLNLVCLSDSPAIDVVADLKNPERLLRDHIGFRDCFPLKISAIDKYHPFVMDYDHLPYSPLWQIGDSAPQLQVTYNDINGNEFAETFVLEVRNSIGSLQVGDPPLERISKAIEGVSSEISYLIDAIRKSKSIR